MADRTDDLFDPNRLNKYWKETPLSPVPEIPPNITLFDEFRHTLESEYPEHRKALQYFLERARELVVAQTPSEEYEGLEGKELTENREKLRELFDQLEDLLEGLEWMKHSAKN